MKNQLLIMLLSVLSFSFHLIAQDSDAAFKRMGALFKDMGAKALFINLKDSTGRLNAMLELSAKMDLPMERIDACNGQDVVREHPEWVILMMNDVYYTTLLAQIHCSACTMSHLLAIQRCIDLETPFVLICEDDVYLPCENIGECCNAFEKALHDLTAIDNNWDILYLGGLAEGSKKWFAFKGISVVEINLTDNLSKINAMFGVHAVLYSRRGLLKIKNLVDSFMKRQVILYKERYGSVDVEEKNKILFQEVEFLGKISKQERYKYASRIKIDSKCARVLAYDYVLAHATISGIIRAYAMNPFIMGQTAGYSEVLGSSTTYDTTLGKYR